MWDSVTWLVTIGHGCVAERRQEREKLRAEEEEGEVFRGAVGKKERGGRTTLV